MTTEEKSEWQKPSVYSVAIIIGVLALIGVAIVLKQVSMTAGLLAALLGVITWMTNGARPPVLENIAAKMSKPPPPMPSQRLGEEDPTDPGARP